MHTASSADNKSLSGGIAQLTRGHQDLGIAPGLFWYACPCPYDPSVLRARIPERVRARARVRTGLLFLGLFRPAVFQRDGPVEHQRARLGVALVDAEVAHP